MHAPSPGRDSAEEIVADFERAHAARFGFFDRGRSLVLEAVSVEAVGAGALLAAEGRRPKQPTDVSDAQPGDPPQATRSVRFFSSGSWHDAAVHLRGELSEGDQVSGPALIIEPHQTVVVEPGTHLPDITVCTPVFDETGAELLFWVAARGPAGPGFDGADAVQTHMTNTRPTDPEALELQYRVVLEDFHIRAGSGGRGRWHAGDGVSRTIRFLESMTVTILSGHRRVRPFGLAGSPPGEPPGGLPGEVGRNCVLRAAGSSEQLPGCTTAALGPGDSVTIETPTGGGYGAPTESQDGSSETPL